MLTFTADTTLYTADTTLFSADMTSLQPSYSMILIDEQSKEVVNDVVEITVSGNYTSIDIDHTFIQDRFYTIELRNGSTVAYRGKIFCTNQTPADTYTTQDGLYTALSSTVEYKTL